MPFESTEERLERLEEVMDRIVKMLSRQNEHLINSLQFTVLLKTEVNALARCLASLPVLGDAKARQPLLDMVSKIESDFEQLEATVRDLKTLPPKIDPPPTPTDPPPG